MLMFFVCWSVAMILVGVGIETMIVTGKQRTSA